MLASPIRRRVPVTTKIERILLSSAWCLPPILALYRGYAIEASAMP
jgi:hypothetical protein